MLGCYRVYKWHVTVPDTKGHIIRLIYDVNKIALCEDHVLQSVRDVVSAAKPFVRLT
jgi:hypothetical protein